MQALWFGDSFTVGTELAHHYGENPDIDFAPEYRSGIDRPDLAFPKLVSDHMNWDCLVLGRAGSSVLFAYYQLLKHLEAVPETDQPRRVFLCTTGQFREFQINLDGTHNHYWEHLQTIPRDKNNYYHNEIVLNAFYHTCKSYKIQCDILNVWYGWETLYVDTIPQSAWLMRNTVELDDSLKYPCEYHPNPSGHLVIADKIINALQRQT